MNNIQNLKKAINLRLVVKDCFKNYNVRSISKNGIGSFYNINDNICRCNRFSSFNNARLVSTVSTAKDISDEDGVFAKFMKKIPFLNIQKHRIRVAGHMLYEEIVDTINCIDFIDKFELPDTFYTWFVVTELHIWMVSVRGMAEGDDGRALRNGMVEALWVDVAQRIKKLGVVGTTQMREEITELSEQLQAALIAYDEGLQSNDTVLAGALWRRCYQYKYTSPENLEGLVKYVRKQITLLDNIPSKKLFKDKKIHWEPLEKLGSGHLRPKLQ